MQVFTLKKGARSLTSVVSFISSLSREKSWRIEVREYRRSRSDEQNNSLWGVAYPPITKATGIDPEELHHIMCEFYFGAVEYEAFGKRYSKPRRTTTRDEHGRRNVLSTTDFMDFYAFVQRKAAEFGVYVPDPGEMTDAS